MRNFPKIFALHEETKKPVQVPSDSDKWPESWKKVEFKEYKRFPKFLLPEPKQLSTSLQNVLENRRSRREFDKEGTLTSEEISSLLFWAAGIKENRENPEKSTRFHPSGGARYPLEIYLYFRGNPEIPEGFYHYNIKGHHLESLPVENPAEAVRSLPTYDFAYDAPLFIFITAIFDRTMRKYSERGYRFANLEAGVVFENFYLVAEALGLAACGIGSALDKKLEEILELEDDVESYLTALVFGRKKNERRA